MSTPRRARESTKIGLSPGTLIHIGQRRSEQVSLCGTRATAEAVEVNDALEPAAAAAFAKPDALTWIDVNGIHDVDLVRAVAQGFGLHPLMQEDLVNATQRPKAEDYGEHYFLVLKMLLYDDVQGEVDAEQVSLVLGKHYVLTLQEREADTFDPVRLRLHMDDSRVRNQGADYLAYALIDTIVDNYFLVIERLGDRIEALEAVAITSPRVETLEEVYALERALLHLRRLTLPARDAIGQLRRAETPLLQPATRVYLRDVEDHLNQVCDTIAMYKDVVQGLVQAYLSSVSNQMNDVMRVLTLIATIFIPLSVVVGIYGMNFDHMPELSWRYGYPMVWVVMLAIAGGLITLFRRRRWL